MASNNSTPNTTTNSGVPSCGNLVSIASTVTSTTPASPTPASPTPASPPPASPTPASPTPASPTSASPPPASPTPASPTPASITPASPTLRKHRKDMERLARAGQVVVKGGKGGKSVEAQERLAEGRKKGGMARKKQLAGTSGYGEIGRKGGKAPKKKRRRE